MAQRKAFPLRLEPAVYEAVERWAGAELRSVNAQIEFLLRRALQQEGRLPRTGPPDGHADERQEQKRE
jgi:hypothetical protein